MAAELEITECIQRMILQTSRELRSIADLYIAGYMEPADDVGGYYYNVLQREGTVAISIRKEKIRSILKRKIPGEEVMVWRMLWEIIIYKLRYHQ
jgi:hypothetical protein